ncbi:MAG: hypothetical protein JWR50_1403 [Mucilaginibacter sp.]|nr:hypothetical protein [Mucilaginibacter sp.]
MKKIFSNLQLGLLGLVVALASSCKHEKLADAIKTQSVTSVTASIDGKLEIGSKSKFTLDGASLTVPVTIAFSSATSTTFTIDLTPNVDTVASLVSSGVLPAGTTAFASGSAAVARQITVPAGVTSVSFDVIVSRSALELGYPKDIAAVIKLSNPTKGNKLASGKSNMILVVHTTELLDASSIHEIAFGTPSNVVTVANNPLYYIKGSLSVAVNIPITLQGDPGASFTVDVASAPDSVTKYINNGTLTKSQLYPNSKISISTPQVKVLDGQNTGYLTFTTPLNTLLAVQPGPAMPTVDMPTVAFTISNPSKYQITKTKLKTVFVKLDPNFFRPYLGAPFTINGTIGVASSVFYAVQYDFGGEGVAYHDDGNKDGDGSFRLPDFVDANPDYSPRTVVGWTSDNEWLSYSINVPVTGDYQADTYLGTSADNCFYSIYVDGVLQNASPLPVKNTTDYRNQQANSTTLHLTAGYHIYKVFWNHAQYDYRGTILTRKS